MLTAHRDAERDIVVDAGAARDLTADRLGEEVAVDPADEVDRCPLGPGHLFHGGEDLAFAFDIADGSLGRGFLPGDIADDTEALRDQLHDALIEGAEPLAQREEFSVGFGHAASLRAAVSSEAAAR